MRYAQNYLGYKDEYLRESYDKHAFVMLSEVEESL